MVQLVLYINYIICVLMINCIHHPFWAWCRWSIDHNLDLLIFTLAKAFYIPALIIQVQQKLLLVIIYKEKLPWLPKHENICSLYAGLRLVIEEALETEMQLRDLNNQYLTLGLQQYMIIKQLKLIILWWYGELAGVNRILIREEMYYELGIRDAS